MALLLLLLLQQLGLTSALSETSANYRNPNAADTFIALRRSFFLSLSLTPLSSSAAVSRDFCDGMTVYNGERERTGRIIGERSSEGNNKCRERERRGLVRGPSCGFEQLSFRGVEAAY